MGLRRSERVRKEIEQQLALFGLRGGDRDAAVVVLQSVAEGTSLAEILAKQPGTLLEGLRALQKARVFSYDDPGLSRLVRWAKGLGAP